MAGLMDQVVGHAENKNWLLRQAGAGQLPSSLIFHGPPGIGKKFLATALLQVLNCQHSEGACGECSDCRRVFEEQNEMVYHLGLEGKKNISVSQVRDILQFLTLRSVKPARFVIIDPAERLSASAANALLKVLEESPEKTYFILITSQMRRLLPTIRSRSHILKFHPLQEGELRAYRNFSEMALQWSDGQLQMALELEDEQAIEQLNSSLRFLYALLCEGPQEWKKTAPWFFRDESARRFSFSIWRQALLKRLHQKGENLDWIPESSAAITRLYENMELLQSDIDRNVDKVLAIENFYYGLRSLEPRS